jgi:Flp pilus assembly protein TadD
MADCQMFGLKAAGHHFTSLVLHTLNALLIYLIFRKATGAKWQSAFMAALFALHPLHVESVAWVAERKDVLSTFFGLLAMWCYVQYAQSAGHTGKVRAPVSYGLALLFFACGLMSKPMLVTWPFLFLLIDFWPLQRRISRGSPSRPSVTAVRLILEKLPFLALSVASCIATIFVQHGKTMMTLEQLSMSARLGNVVVSYATYILQMFWPIKLCIFYPLTGAPIAWNVVVAAVLLIALTILAMRSARSRTFILVGWLWFFGALVPVIGLVHVGEQSHADRYTYIPLVGLFVAITWSAMDWANNRPWARRFLPVMAIAVLGMCAFISWRQTAFWKSSETVMRRALDVTTDNFLAHNNLGTVLADQQKVDEAESHYREAIRIKPYYSRAYSNLGTALVLKGQLEEAIPFYEKSLQFRPNDAQAHHNLAVTFARLKRYDDTIVQCREALKDDPNYGVAYFDLALALRLTGKVPEAAVEFEKAVGFNPGDAAAHYQFAVTLAQLQRGPEALAQYQQAVQIDPGLSNPKLAEHLRQLMETQK